MERTETLVFNQGYIETEFGRRRRFEKERDMYHSNGRSILFEPLELWQRFHDMPATYERMKSIAGQVKNARNNALNVQIQGLAAHIINRASIEVAKEYAKLGLKSYICGLVHDEIIVHSPQHEADTAAKILQDKMENVTVLTVPLVAKPSFGKTYAESKG